MKIITHNITLDVASPHTRGRMFEVKRKDGGTHTINFTLTENGTAISEYDGVTAYRIRVLHMDKSSTETEYTDFAGTIKHTLSAADLGVFGDALCEVSLYDDSGSRLTSAAFGFFIVPDINTDEGVLNDSNYPVLDNLIKTVNENLSGVESMTKKANDLITKAETVGSNASNLEEALQTINNNVNAKASEVKSNSDRAETAADSANSAMSRAETAANSSETEASKAQSAKNNAVTAQQAAELAQGKAETAADNAIAAKTAAEAAKTDVEAYMESDKFHTHDNKAWLDKLVYLDAYPTYSTVGTVSVGNVDVSVFNKIDSNFIYTIDVKKDTIWEELKNYALNNSDFTPIGPIPGEATMFRTDKNNTFCIFLQSFITYDAIDSVLKKHTIRAIQYFIEPSRKVYSRTITKTVIDETVSYTYADFKRIDGEDKVDKIEGKDLIDTDVADNISIKNYGTNDVFTVATPEVDFKFVNAETINIPTADDIHWGTNTTLQTELDKKVDKVTGKGLSTNDYTDTDKAEVAKVKDKANRYNSSGGFEGGNSARTEKGGAVGKYAAANGAGGAVGYTAISEGGFAGGEFARSIAGGAVGYWAESGDGFAGGKSAKTVDTDNKIIDAIQLGTGTNTVEKTLQVYNYQLMDAEGNIPVERLNNVRSVSPQVSASLPDMLKVNTIYDLGLRTTLSIQLPNANYGEFIQVDFYSGETKTNLNIISPLGLANYDLTPEPNTMYSLFFDFGTVYATSTIKSWGWRFGYAEYPYEEV